MSRLSVILLIVVVGLIAIAFSGYQGLINDPRVTTEIKCQYLDESKVCAFQYSTTTGQTIVDGILELALMLRDVGCEGADHIQFQPQHFGTRIVGVCTATSDGYIPRGGLPPFNTKPRSPERGLVPYKPTPQAEVDVMT